MTLVRVGTKPNRLKKLSKASKDKISRKMSDDHFFSRAKEYWIKQQDWMVANHTWQGWVSPSAKMNFNMCMEALFEEQVKQPVRMNKKALYHARIGGALHEGLSRTFAKIQGFRFAEPRLNDSEESAWYKEKVWPEFTVWCRYSGFKGKVDYVIEKNGRPAVVDLKNTWQDSHRWRYVSLPDRLPKINDVVQLCIYANRLNAAEVFEKKIREVAPAYVNWTEKPLTKFWSKVIWIDYWNDYRHRTNDLVLAIADGWEQAKATGRVRCNNPFCEIHGRKR